MIVPTNRRFEAGNAFSVRAGLDFVLPVLDFVSPLLQSVKPMLHFVTDLLDSVFPLLGFVKPLIDIVRVKHSSDLALPSPVVASVDSDALVLFSVGPLHQFVTGALDCAAPLLEIARAHDRSVTTTPSSVTTTHSSVKPHACADGLLLDCVRPLWYSV